MHEPATTRYRTSTIVAFSPNPPLNFIHVSSVVQRLFLFFHLVQEQQEENRKGSAVPCTIVSALTWELNYRLACIGIYTCSLVLVHSQLYISWRDENGKLASFSLERLKIRRQENVRHHACIKVGT